MRYYLEVTNSQENPITLQADENERAKPGDLVVVDAIDGPHMERYVDGLSSVIGPVIGWRRM